MKVFATFRKMNIFILIITTVCAFDRTSEVFPPDYNKYESPGYRGRPAHLYLDLSIMDIDRIDEGRMEFSLQTYIKESWQDWRLNMSAFVGKERPAFPQTLVKDIWIPDLVFDNAKTGILFSLSVPNTHVGVYPDGWFARQSRYNLVIGCQMNFLYYPMDTQLCFLKLALLSNPDYKVMLHWANERSNPYRVPEAIRFTNEIEALKYKLEPPRTYKTQEQWTAGNYTYLYANFTFVRRISGSLLNIYIPSTLIVCLSWISFWLDVSAVPARVTLGATSLLTLVTHMIQARNGLPAISYMTAMDIWLFACLFTVFSSLLAYAFTYHVHLLHKKNAIHDFQHQNFKSECDLRGHRRSPKLTMAKSEQMRSKTFKAEKNVKTQWAQLKDVTLDKYWQILFPLTFTSFAIIYWTFYIWCT